MSYRVAILGAGKLGQTHLRHWNAIPEAQIVSVLDTNVEIANRLGIAASYADLGALLRETKPDIVDICTPTPAHRDQIEQAAASGAAIFVEKPIARTLADCDAIVSTVERTGVPLMAGHVVRYFPAYRHAKQIVDRGGVGNPAAIRAERLAAFPKRGGSQSWYADPDQSGGVVLDAMLHDFDWLRWCLGPVQRVYAKGLHGRPDCAGLLDYALVTLRFTSGAVAHVTGSWAHSGPMRTRFEIAGDEGMVEYNSAASATLQIQITGNPAGAISESPLSAADDPYYCELRDFVDALAGNAAMPITVYDAREAVRIALAAIRSIEIGQAVALS